MTRSPVCDDDVFCTPSLFRLNMFDYAVSTTPTPPPPPSTASAKKKEKTIPYVMLNCERNTTKDTKEEACNLHMITKTNNTQKKNHQDSPSFLFFFPLPHFLILLLFFFSCFVSPLLFVDRGRVKRTSGTRASSPTTAVFNAFSYFCFVAAARHM